MKHSPQSFVVICSYQPKPGKQTEVLDLLSQHVPTLRRLGMATAYPRQLLLGENNAVIEIFEWESEAAARSAGDNPEVTKIWEAIAEVAEFVPLSSLQETQKPFAHFKQVENPRKHRVIHFEIESDDPRKVAKFYETAFGWTFRQFGENEYWLADTGREPCAGIDGAVMKRKQPRTNVTNTIRVESVDEQVQKVTHAGGKVCTPKMAVPGVGFLAYCSDPEGNVFGLIQMDRGAK